MNSQVISAVHPVLAILRNKDWRIAELEALVATRDAELATVRAAMQQLLLASSEPEYKGGAAPAAEEVN